MGDRRCSVQNKRDVCITLWDRSERRLVLARDRVGKKLLYYGWSNAGTACSPMVGTLGDIDIQTCSECGGPVKVIACIEDPMVIGKILSSGWVRKI